MSLYKSVKDSIVKNKTIKQGGGYIGVPMPFPRLSEYIPIIERGHSIGVLGATGCGKSRFVRWLFLYHAFKFHKETGYPLRIIYLPLEDDKEKVYRNLICHYMFDLYGIYISLQELDSKGKRELPDFVEEKLEEASEFFKDFESIVTIVDGMNEPTEIFDYCEEYALKTGDIEEYSVDVGGIEKIQKRYKAHNDVHTIVIVDNMSNIDVEKGTKDEREAIVRFCKTYVRGELCNFYKFTVVQVLQQDFASERQSFTGDGKSIIAKLEPSLASIGDSKTVSRSMHIVLGIFHPSRFGITQYPTPSKHDQDNCYRLDLLGNRFRSLSILKANDSDFGMKLAFNFNAVNEIMEELPLPKTPEIERIYNKIREKNSFGKFSKITQAEIIEEDDDSEEAPF